MSYSRPILPKDFLRVLFLRALRNLINVYSPVKYSEEKGFQKNAEPGPNPLGMADRTLLFRYIEENRNNPAGLNVRLLEGDTVLTTAVRIEDENLFMSLVGIKGIVNSIGHQDRTPLSQACFSRTMKATSIIQRLLAFPDIDVNAVPVDRYGQMGCTALFYAAIFGQVEALDLLIQHGARKDIDGERALQSVKNTLKDMAAIPHPTPEDDQGILRLRIVLHMLQEELSLDDARDKALKQWGKPIVYNDSEMIQPVGFASLLKTKAPQKELDVEHKYAESKTSDAAPELLTPLMIPPSPPPPLARRPLASLSPLSSSPTASGLPLYGSLHSPSALSNSASGSLENNRERSMSPTSNNASSSSSIPTPSSFLSYPSTLFREGELSSRQNGVPVIEEEKPDDIDELEAKPFQPGKKGT